MWCVPTAVAALTGWSREKVWLDILAERHERGRRLTNLPGRIDQPHGGLHAAEAIRSLERSGHRVIDLWPGTRRWTVAEFCKHADTHAVDRGEGLLVLQRMHLGYYGDSLDHTLIDGLPVAKAWRVVRVRP